MLSSRLSVPCANASFVSGYNVRAVEKPQHAKCGCLHISWFDRLIFLSLFLSCFSKRQMKHKCTLEYATR